VKLASQLSALPISSVISAMEWLHSLGNPALLKRHLYSASADTTRLPKWSLIYIVSLPSYA
jgi:hypothetical protein